MQSITKEIAAIKNCKIAQWKNINEHIYFFVNFFLSILVCWAEIFRDNVSCYALSIFRDFILVASSDNNKRI